MKFFFGVNGYPSIKASDDFRILADFIKDDIQRSIYGVNELIDTCELVKSGVLPFWEGTGNSHTVTIRSDCVELLNEYTEESMIISSVDEFKEYLDKWRALISDGNGL